jgi:drug/metabolite transporter (DMT)-like permease
MNLAAINMIGLAIFSVMLAIGQLLFKQSGLSMRGMPLVDGLLSLARLPAFYAALCLYGFATLLWVWLLSRVTLMQAYPWVSAGVVIVPLLSGFIFGERVTPVYWFGAALVVAGIAVTQYSVQN